MIWAEALEPLDAEWRIFARLRYTFLVRDRPHLAFVRYLDFFDTPQVHAGDADALADTIAGSLGFVTDRTKQQVFDLFPTLGSPLVPRRELRLLDESGALTAHGQEALAQAYTADLAFAETYLTELEGHELASQMRLSVPVYQDSAPEGFVPLHNPGGGSCLLHALGQIRAFKRTRRLIRGLSNGEIAAWRFGLVDRMSLRDHRDDVLALCAAYVQTHLGGGEAGLGPNLTRLLSTIDVPEPGPAVEPMEVDSESPAPDTAGERDESPADDVEPAEPQPRAQFGDGEAIDGLALMHLGGNHYVALIREDILQWLDEVTGWTPGPDARSTRPLKPEDRAVLELVGDRLIKKPSSLKRPREDDEDEPGESEKTKPRPDPDPGS